MRYIEVLKEGDRINEIYMCKVKQSLMTKNGKPYDSVILQDKTGTIDGKIWDPSSMGIDDFDALDYVNISADVTNFQGQLQLNIKRVRKCSEGEYDPKDYLPVSDKNTDDMYDELVKLLGTVNNTYLKALIDSFYAHPEFKKMFSFHSAAKSVHHGFVGGLLEHTLSVTKLCDYFSKSYPVVNRDLLLTAAAFHDVGKLKELSTFPENDYTDDGQLLGHIVMGAMWVDEHIKKIEGFPKKLASELKHCILAHHGELEYGSPKKPALVEAVALNLADNADAKMQTMKEALESTAAVGTEWLGYNKFFESNIRRTGKEY